MRSHPSACSLVPLYTVSLRSWSATSNFESPSPYRSTRRTHPPCVLSPATGSCHAFSHTDSCWVGFDDEALTGPSAVVAACQSKMMALESHNEVDRANASAEYCARLYHELLWEEQSRGASSASLIISNDLQIAIAPLPPLSTGPGLRPAPNLARGTPRAERSWTHSRRSYSENPEPLCVQTARAAARLAPPAHHHRSRHHHHFPTDSLIRDCPPAMGQSTNS
eukprot:COSAG02_NODE_4563_length_5214_cov_17.431085_4_plen_223_part_00